MQLEITADSIVPNRAELTCASIFASMLWEDDERARRKWIETATARFMAASLYGNPVAQQAAHQSLFDLALGATPPKELEAVAGPLYAEGVIVGETVLAAISDFAADGRVNLEFLRRLQTDPARRRTHPWLDHSAPALGRHWHRFTRTRHLWAAHAAAAVEGYDPHPPCSPGRLVDFLALAHAIALAGSHYVRPNRKPPMLDKNLLLMVPPAIHPRIAAVEQVFHQLR